MTFIKRRRRSRSAIVVLWIGLLAVLGVRPTAVQPPLPNVQTPQEITIQRAALGPLFGDVNGFTLYVSDRDVDPGKSACSSACTDEWIPVRASANAEPFGDWTLVPREDGAPQWAYKGRPLYRYAKESQPRSAEGQGDRWQYAVVVPFPAPGSAPLARGLGGFGGPGFAAAGRGQAGQAAALAAAGLAQGGQAAARFLGRGAPRPQIPLPPGTPSGITTQTSASGPVFGDGKGFTLYTSSASALCAGQCLDTWKPLTAPQLATAPGGDWTIMTRADGTPQWAYKGKPVFRSVKDIKAGDIKGEGGEWHPVHVPTVAVAAPPDGR